MARSKTKSSQRNKLAKQSQTNAKRKPSRASNSRSGTTKHDRVLDLLRAKGGTTIAAITKATGWQPYSVRGFLAGVVQEEARLQPIVREDRRRAGLSDHCHRFALRLPRSSPMRRPSKQSETSSVMSIDDQIARLRDLDLTGLREIEFRSGSGANVQAATASAPA